MKYGIALLLVSVVIVSEMYAMEQPYDMQECGSGRNRPLYSGRNNELIDERDEQDTNNLPSAQIRPQLSPRRTNVHNIAHLIIINLEDAYCAN